MRFFSSLTLGAELLLWLSMASKAQATTTAHDKRQDTGNSTSWQQYVRAPSTSTIYPSSIVSQNTTGNVTNASGLLQSGGDYTIFNVTNSTGEETSSVVVDFGQNVVGYLQINFAGASDNFPGIQLAFSETLEYLTNTSDFTRSDNGDTITPGTDQIAVEAEPYTWTDALGCANGTKVCTDGLHGFRYLKISLSALDSDSPDTSSYGQVSIDSVHLNYSAFLGTPSTFTGNFECSDEVLTQYWYDAVYTNDMCIEIFDANSSDPRGAASESLLGKLVIYDGAKRDRDPYSGDLAVSAKTAYLSHDVSEAAKSVLADLADHQRADGWIPPATISNYSLNLYDYPLWWVVCSYDLYMYTNDTSYISKYYPNLSLVLDSFYPSTTNTSTNLLSKGLGVTYGYGDYAFLSRTGEVTYYNALYVLALNRAASIATFLNSLFTDASRWSTRAATVSAAINTYLFDSSAGAFIDAPNATTISHPQDGNGIAVLSGAANVSRATSSLNYLANNTALAYGNAFYDNDAVGTEFSQRVYAFISYFELSARFITPGLASSALEEIGRLYGWMANHDPYLTFWEGIGTNGEPYEGAYTSLAHAWSTGIVPLLSNHVLGVTPTAPGFETYEVKPRVVGSEITWARGTVPAPSGEIEVSWQTTVSGLEITVQGPIGCNANVSVPVGGSGNETAGYEGFKLYVDGVLAWDGDGEGNSTLSVDSEGFVTVLVQGGVQHIVSLNSTTSY